MSVIMLVAMLASACASPAVQELAVGGLSRADPQTGTHTQMETHPRRSTGAAVASKIHVFAFMTDVTWSMGPFLASANLNIGPVSVLGFGEQASWGPELEKKINAARRFLFQLDAPEEDLVLMMDSYDTLVLGDSPGILSRFAALERRTGRQIFFSAETDCAGAFCQPMAEVAKQQFNVTTPWIYLNSGLIAGRLGALRAMLESPANLTDCPECYADQEWYSRYFLQHGDVVGLDYRCELLQIVFNVDNIIVHSRPGSNQPVGALLLSPSPGWVDNGNNNSNNNRVLLVNVVTGTQPALLHFPGPGHWPLSEACAEDPSILCQTSVYYEVFRRALPEAWAGLRLKEAAQKGSMMQMPSFLRRFRGYHMFTAATLVDEAVNAEMKLRILAMVFALVLSSICVVTALILTMRARRTKLLMFFFLMASVSTIAMRVLSTAR
ncbi:unnamed protein product [Polarella glacialis]|uniref:PLOD1-3-like GT domain-containing protein n=1 Tax=Polarella glacialis TaxID=89957 RepID=A0A813E281_POLGL|nr:unnamed protein product [Polarella glacialis]